MFNSARPAFGSGSSTPFSFGSTATTTQPGFGNTSFGRPAFGTPVSIYLIFMLPIKVNRLSILLIFKFIDETNHLKFYGLFSSNKQLDLLDLEVVQVLLVHLYLVLSLNPKLEDYLDKLKIQLQVLGLQHQDLVPTVEDCL